MLNVQFATKALRREVSLKKILVLCFGVIEREK